ncbi:MAG: DJ-1/PfpI family protein [Nitrospinae bacterium]|nr:DJ-1/PfpI family protein [Nitrospinota bacterium]
MISHDFLLVVPQNRFCEQQLFDLKDVLAKYSGRCVVLSKSGKEAKGEAKSLLQPDGMVVDWNRHLFGKKKYDAVIVIGGKGSRSSIWEDPILPQILTDHFRAGKILGAFGLSVIALARAGLISRYEVSAPKDELCLKELESVGAYAEEKDLVVADRIITSNSEGSGKIFGEAILELLDN